MAFLPWRLPAAFVAVVLCLSPALAAPSDPARVLVLHSYHQGFEWTDSVQQGIESAFKKAAVSVEFSIEYMDAKRHPVETTEAPLLKVLTARSRRWRPDVIISCDDDALAFLFQHHETFCAGVPVVFCGLNVEDYDPSLLDGRTGYTGVVERLDLAATIDLISRLQPKVRRILFIHDRTTSGLADRRTIETLAPRFADRLEFVYPDSGSGLSVPELLDKLRALKSDAAVYFLGFFRDRTGRPLAPGAIIPQISKASPVPVYSHAEAYLGRGILGGQLLSGFVHGRSTGRRAIQILQGASVNDLPVAVESSNRPMFDYRQLKRFGLRRFRLPEGSVIAFEPTSLFERHRTGLFVSAVAFIALLLFAAALVVDRIRRRRLQKSLAASESMYRLLAEHATDMISKHDAEGRYLFASPSCERLLGYKPEELVGRNAYEFFHPRDVPQIEASHQTITKDGNTVYNIAYRIRGKDGAYRWVETTSRSVTDPANGSPAEIVAVTRDISARLQAEEALRISEQRYQQAVGAGNIGVWDWNLETGEMYLAPALKAMLGYADHEIANRIEAWGVHVHPEDIARVEAETSKCRDDPSQPFDLEHRMLHRNGSVRWFLARGKVEVDAAGRPVRMFGTDTDITTRKEAQEALRSERSFIQAVLDTDPSVIFVKDEHARFVLVNQACAELYHTTPGELRGRLNAEVVTDAEEYAGYRAVDRQVLETGRSCTLEEPHTDRDGVTTWFLTTKARIILPDGRPGVLGVCVDLTERRLAEEALRQTEERFRTVLENLPGALFAHDLNGRISMVNEKSVHYTGYSRAELLGMNIRDIDPQSVERDDRGRLWEALKEGDSIMIEVTHRRKDGSEYPAEVYLDAIGLGDEPTMLAVAVDTSERRRLEEQQRDLELQVQQARRHESLATMAGAIAHNFNNILMGVMGNLDIAAGGMDPDDASLEFVRLGRRSAARAAELSRLMLLYVGGADVEQTYDPLCVRDLLRGMRDELQALADEKARVEFNWSETDGPFVVEGDRSQIAQAVTNVVTNAVEAMDARQGHIVVEISVREFDAGELAASHVAATSDPGRFVCLRITDDGAGMTPETRQRLFEPYFSTRFVGRGLGLAVVLGIVRGHHGALLVKSREGEGSDIRILLPVFQPDPFADAPPSGAGGRTQRADVPLPRPPRATRPRLEG